MASGRWQSANGLSLFGNELARASQTRSLFFGLQAALVSLYWAKPRPASRTKPAAPDPPETPSSSPVQGPFNNGPRRRVVIMGMMEASPVGAVGNMVWGEAGWACSRGSLISRLAALASDAGGAAVGTWARERVSGWQWGCPIHDATPT